MNLFLDANVLVAVLNRVYPVFSDAARVMSLGDRGGFNLFTSPICLAISFYFAEKKSGTVLARNKVALLSSHIRVTPMDADTVRQAVANKRIQDFEDGLEYYAAIQSGCNVILTEDQEGFYFSDVLVYRCQDFLAQYA